MQWYRPWPPDETVVWSLRNNTNYMEAGVLSALEYTADHAAELLHDFWIKGNRSLEKGRTEAPYAWAFPETQRDPGRLAYLINQLRRHHIEVHRLDADWKKGDRSFPAGTWIVRMDQPYRNAAVNFLEKQNFPADEPNPPYDDVAWTFPLVYGVEGSKIDDAGILEAKMTAVSEDVRPEGSVSGRGSLFLMADTGQNAVLQARLLLGDGKVSVAEEAFDAAGKHYPAGSWILQGSRDQVESLAKRTGLSFQATGKAPEVGTHEIDIPRIAVFHTWTSTQDAGWVRYLFDQEKLPYTLINPDDLKQGGLGRRFDVILVPNLWGNFSRMVHGIDPKYGPLAYTTTPRYPSHGIPDGSDDITGGMGLSGLMHLQDFVREGGLLITLANGGTLAVDGGMVRGVRNASQGISSPGSEVTAKVLAPSHPLTYGYETMTSVFRGNGPVFDVDASERERVILQFGTKEVEAANEPRITSIDDQTDQAKAKKSGETKPKEEGPELVQSGFVKGKELLDGKPAVLDEPAGQGRVVIFNFNPLHRYINHSDFRLVYNLLLNWNDLAPRGPGSASAR